MPKLGESPAPLFYTGRNGYKICIRAKYLGHGEETHLSILMRGTTSLAV